MAKQVLVLNRAFLPIQITTVRHAIELLCQERAKVVNSEYVTFSLDEWMIESAMVFKQQGSNDADVIRSISAMVLLPKVITLTDYTVVPKRIMRFRRRDVFQRDNHACQYCSNQYPVEELTLDHIVPRSRGGVTTWENCITSCRPCNTVKADRTPQEAGMPLIGGIPRKPNANFHFSRKIQSDTTWAKFL